MKIVFMTRPDWDDYFLGIAEAVSRRGECTRSKVGAVIVYNRRIVACGYNGAPAGAPSCLTGACPRGQHYPYPGPTPVPECQCGLRWPCPVGSVPGSDYSNCIATHAEHNALNHLPDAYRWQVNSLLIYTTRAPCYACVDLLAQWGIHPHHTHYPDKDWRILT